MQIGDLIPDIKLVDQNNNEVSLRSLANDNSLIVYFYPKDNTPGCTAEACSFRDSFQDFTEYNANVVGISNDSPASHRAFISKHQLNFPLLSDKNGKAARAFGVKRQILGLLPGRTTFVFDKGGKLIDIISSALNPRIHVTASLERIRKSVKN